MKRAALIIAIGVALVGGGTVATSSVASAAKPKVPSIRAIAPEHGPLAGGTTVIISGKNLGGVTSVLFGSTPSPLVTPVTQGEILAQSPAGIGTVDITVTSALGTSATGSADQFTYVTTPTIQKIAPRGGSTLGGNRVTIVGAGFTGATSVSFGSLAAASFAVQSDQEIIAITPAQPVGDVDVSVTAPTGSTPIDPADVYGYSLKVPVITSVTPDFGPAAGGTTVTISGRNFKGSSAVTFGLTPAASFTVNSAKSITAVAPPGVVGAVDVTLTNVSGVSGVSAVDQFTYQP
jgi:hypothetical protein